MVAEDKIFCTAQKVKDELKGLSIPKTASLNLNYLNSMTQSKEGIYTRGKKKLKLDLSVMLKANETYEQSIDGDRMVAVSGKPHLPDILYWNTLTPCCS